MASGESGLSIGETFGCSFVSARMVKAARAAAVRGIKAAIEASEDGPAVAALREVLALLGLTVDEAGEEVDVD